MEGTKEPFSWSKLWAGFTGAVGWVKAASLAIRIVCIASVLGVPAFAYFKGYQKAKAAYYMPRYQEGYSQAIKDHPPVTINGNNASVNNNVCPKVSNVGITLGPLGNFGWSKTKP